MPVNEFEKQVQQKMEELKFVPSAEVWTEVEKRIRKEKKRRRIIFWWLVPALLLGSGTVYFINKKETKETIVNAQGILQEQQVDDNNKTGSQVNDITKTREAGEKTSNQPGNSEDRSTADKVIPGNDQQIYQQDAAAEIIAIKAATVKKKKGKKDNDAAISPVAVKEDMQVVVADAAVKKNEQPVPAATGEITGMTGDKSTKVEKIVEETKDSASLVNKEEKKETEQLETAAGSNPVADAKKSGKNKKWDIGFGVNTGSSNIWWGSLFDGRQAMYDATPLYNTGSGAPGQPVYIAAPDRGLSAGLELFAQRSITRKLDLRVGIHYDYLSNHIKTGNRVDSSRQVNNSISDGLTVSNYYRPPSGSSRNDYTNQYHLAGISAAVSWQVIRGNKFQLSWENRVAVSRLLSTNALHYDRNLQAYYRDFEPFRKTQVFVSTGLSAPLISKDGFRMTVNPFVAYNLSPVLKKNTGLSTHHFNYGIGFKFLFPPKK